MNTVHKALMAVVFTVTATLSGHAVEGLITKQSNHPYTQTLDRLDKATKTRGYIIYARYDHADGAATVGLKMPRSTVVIFANPRVGTDLVVRHPTLALDLPLKALVWEDASGKVSISYNSAHYLFHSILVRHGVVLTPELLKQMERTEGRLAGVVEDATR